MIIHTEVHWESAVFTWVYCIIWFIVQEVAKLSCYAFMDIGKKEELKHNTKQLEISSVTINRTSSDIKKVQNKIKSR